MIQVLWWPMYFSLTYYILVSIVWPLPWLELRPGEVIWFENDQSESRKQPTRRPRGWKDRVRYVQMTTLKEIGDLPLHHTSLIILPNINCVVQCQMTITTHTTATQYHWSPQAHPITWNIPYHSPQAHTITWHIPYHSPQANTITWNILYHSPQANTITWNISYHSLQAHTITWNIPYHSPQAHTITWNIPNHHSPKADSITWDIPYHSPQSTYNNMKYT